MKHFLYRVFCGFFLGISVFAPGVSGSVMAVMMGIYDRLLGIVADPFKNIRRNIVYLFPMGIGAVISLVLFVLLFGYLFETYEKATYFLFMGLIAGNIPVIFKDAARDGVKKRHVLAAAAAFGIALAVALVRAGMPAEGGLADLSVNYFYLGLCGAVAGVSSMVPGMSISMILMVLGVYERLLHAARQIEIPVILVVGACFALGMVMFSKLTRWVFRRHHCLAYFMVGGFMCGSLVGIYLLPKSEANFNWLIGAAALAAGLGLSLLFQRLSRKLGLGDGESPPEGVSPECLPNP